MIVEIYVKIFFKIANYQTLNSTTYVPILLNTNSKRSIHKQNFKNYNSLVLTKIKKAMNTE